MSLSSQKSMQAYLERHEIGKLFEDMMAKLIKEMPNEPISYLIRLLQKINQRRTGGSLGENTYPSSILYKSGMGLTGSSIPLKQSKDPQIILPGSKAATSPWMESTGKEESTDNNNELTNMPRSYEKPWLTGSKPPKGTKEKKDSGKTEPTSWNTDTKSSAKTVDDMFDQKGGEMKKSIFSKSLSPSKENQRSKKSKDRKWSDEPTIEEKENNDPRPGGVGYSFNANSDKKSSSLEDELKIESRPQSVSRKTICSPQTYSKFKRKLSKKKSFENKQKLQALLLTDQSKSPKNDNLDDSTDYEGDDVFEDANELQVEGARSKVSSGLKRTHHKPSTENIKVSVCSRCAQIMGDCNGKPSSVNGPLNMSSDNEEFSSVSQLEPGKSYKPVWTPVSNSEAEDAIHRTDKSKKLNSPKKGVLQKNKFNNNQIAAEDKSDFFEKNNPLRNKTKRFAGDFTSDNESEEGVKVILPTSKAWQQQLDDTGSEADVDEDSHVLEMKSRGWKQKVAKSNVTSDI